MKNIAKRMFKIIEKVNTPPLRAVGVTLLGAGFLLLPETWFDRFIIGVGAAFAVFGIGALIYYSIFERGEVLLPILFSVLGIILLFFGAGVKILLCRAFGAMLLFTSLAKLYYTARILPRRNKGKGGVRMRGRWRNFRMVLLGVFSLFGLFASVLPIYPANFAGAILLIFSFEMSLAPKIWKKGNGNFSDEEYYAATFVDKTRK